MKLVVGLGNPGPEHEWTRHNVGFHVVELLARRANTLFRPGRELEGYRGRRSFDFAALDVRPSPEGPGGPALLVKPTTYMNLSGEVVAPLAAHLAVAPADLMVVYDDLDLPLGALRLRPHGGAGGHNGLRSILDQLATDRFPRLRLGIGAARTDAARHVLERFTRDEMPEIEISVAEAAEAIEHWLSSGDLAGVMTRFHSRWNRGD